MDIEEWKERILGSVESRCGATFANLMSDFGDEAKGEYDLPVPGSRNLVMWSGMSEEFARAVAELHKEGRIRFEPQPELLYAMDGLVLSLPLAYEPKDYPTMHWCPVAIYTTSS